MVSGSNQQRKILYKQFSNYFEAHLFTSILEEYNILYQIKNEAFGTLLPNVIAIEVWVFEQDLIKIEEILLQIQSEVTNAAERPGFEEEWENLSEKNRLCVHCGSKNTRIFEGDEEYSLFHKFFKLKTSHKAQWFCFHCRNKF